MNERWHYKIIRSKFYYDYVKIAWEEGDVQIRDEGNVQEPDNTMEVEINKYLK